MNSLSFSAVNPDYYTPCKNLMGLEKNLHFIVCYPTLYARLIVTAILIIYLIILALLNYILRNIYRIDITLTDIQGDNTIV